MPVLAICRGLQVVNVALGGTLVQDIPSSIPRAIGHTVRDPLNAIAHEVHVDPESRLARLMWPQGAVASTCPVNSRHHQAIKRVADSLVVTATAPDGVIEAIERPASDLLRRRAVAPGEFLEDRRVPAAVRGTGPGGDGTTSPVGRETARRAWPTATVTR